MAEKTRCEICDRTFKDSEGLEMHNKAKHSDNIPKPKKEFKMPISKGWGIFIVILGVLIFGVYWMVTSSANAQELPPTNMAGHTEQVPSSHILKKSMGISVQKHMLEHVDGQDGGPGGIIINYDCDNFECESGLVENLESFAGKYGNVYVAPFNMPVKIALTRLGRIETLDEYDEIKIEIFITGVIPQKEDTTNEPQTSEVPAPEGEGAPETIVVDDNSGNLVGESAIKEFSMTAKQWSFTPNTLTVNQGDLVKLSIKSIDVTHGFSIPAFDVDQRINSGQEITVEFVADKKGTFSFACSVSCGAGHAGMTGKIIVE